MKTSLKHITLAVILVAYAFGFTQNNKWFDEANTLYNQGKYAEAVDKYEAILKTKMQSSELYFNLANANYKLNNIASSIYYYEKALQLKPNDADIKNNLIFAKNMTIDDIEIVPEVGFSRILNNITKILSFDGWAKTAVALILVFILLFLMYYFSYQATKKRFAFIGGILSLLFACFALTLAFHNYNLFKKDKPAIIFADESQVKTEPNLRSEEVFRLHEGTKVQIIDTVNNWKEIKILDGKTGWILSKNLKEL